jgi:tetratricopeptide (TPR) repeat protein
LRRTRLTLALALTFTAQAWAEGPKLRGCDALDGEALARMWAVERRGERAVAATVSCAADGVRLSVRAQGAALARTVRIGKAEPGVRERLVALSLVELAAALPAKLGTIREDAPRAPLLQRILSTSLYATVAFSVVPGFASVQKREVEVVAPPSALAHPPSGTPPRPLTLREDPFEAGERRVRAVVEAQLRVLDRLLAVTPKDDPERPALLHRKGDLWAELARGAGFAARALDEKIHQARRAGRPEAARLAAEQKALEEIRFGDTTEAARVWLEVAEPPGRWPRFARMDELVFHLAWLLDEAGKDEAARGYYKRVVQDHPTSRYVPDALIALADRSFEERDLEIALVLYDKVVDRGESRLRGYALYKRAWCLFESGDVAGALAGFAEALASARGRRDALALEREARRDFVRAFARVGTPARALPAFQRIDAPHASEMLERLAALYAESGRPTDAIRSYRQLLALSPAAPAACQWQREVVRATLAETGGRADARTLTELERLGALADRRPGDGACRDDLASLLSDVGPLWHREAQVTQTTRGFELAHALYARYLARFPSGRQAVPIAFYDGEALYRLGRFCEAAPRYDDVVLRGAKRWLREAAWASVLSWRSCTGDEESPRMLEVYDRYLAHVQGGVERPRVLFRKARVLYTKRRFAEAAPLFAEIVEKHGTVEVAGYAADLYLDCLAALDRPTELAAAASRLCPPSPILHRTAPGFAARCETIRAALARREAEALERAGRHREAGERYLAIAERFPDDPLLDEIYFDAAVELKRARLIGPSVAALRKLGARRPQSRLARKAVFMAAQMLAEIAAYEQAAEEYETFAQLFPGDRDAGPALLRAAFFRRGLGQTDRALADSERYLKLPSRDPDAAAQVTLEGARTAEPLEAWLRTFDRAGGAQLDRRVVAHARLGEIYWQESCPVAGTNGLCAEMRHVPRRASCGAGLAITMHARKSALAARARDHFETALRLYGDGARKDADAAWHAAQARLRLADVTLERFLDSKPPRLDGKRALRAWLDEKERRLGAARRAYEQVIFMKEPHFAIAAAARIGQAFQAWAGALKTAPIPPAPPAPRGVPPRRWARLFEGAYCPAFDDTINTIEDKAADALSRCLKKSVELSWFDEWSALCETELNRLRPRECPLAAELAPVPGYVSTRTP